MAGLPSIRALCPGVSAVVGLTGGIGSGKSNARKVLAKLGAIAIDADKAGHQAYEPGTPAYLQVVETFGPSVVAEDGKINRRALGARVFADPAQMKQLTDIVWPAIIDIVTQDIQRQVAERADATAPNPDTPAVAVVEAAVLLEAGWNTRVDTVWTTYVPADVALQRVISRDACSEEVAKTKLAAQAPVEDKVAAASVVIDTSGPFEATEKQLTDAWSALISSIQAGTFAAS